MSAEIIAFHPRASKDDLLLEERLQRVNAIMSVAQSEQLEPPSVPPGQPHFYADRMQFLIRLAEQWGIDLRIATAIQRSAKRRLRHNPARTDELTPEAYGAR